MSAIAIVGMGCKFAKAADLHGYWKLILDGDNGFGPVPEDRWPVDAVFSTNRRATDKSYAPAGAFIDDIQSFPALTFGLPPRRVEVMDPQQRLALETAVQAIEDAGYTSSTLPYKTGVFLGITAHEYRVLNAFRLGATLMASGFLGEGPEDPTSLAAAVENIVPTRPYTAPGTLGNMSAAIVAQELDLHGPAYTTDAACASAHMAIFDAVCQLRTGAIDAALAGGVYICVTPEHHIVFSRIGAMSAQGECLPFDARADGFVQGDGGGLVLLKRLEDAERDGDRIYAVIKGAAINNDGRGDGPMAPDEAGQCEVIEAAWNDAKVDRSNLGYMEAHGTGTDVGDIAEFNGLVRAFPDLKSDAIIGSSKANVGHTMSAAGLAGLIRATLSVYHKTLPPMAGFNNPKDELDIQNSSFVIPKTPIPWTEEDRYAGISSFGFGGTNGHLVIAGYNQASKPQEQAELVLMSAGTEEGLQHIAKSTAVAMQLNPSMSVASLARAWANRRKQSHRLGFVANGRDEAIEILEAVGRGERPQGSRVGVSGDTPTIAMMFPGQGAQRVGMLRDVRQRFPIVSQTLSELENALAEDLPLPLTHLLYPEQRVDSVDEDTAAAQLTDTAHCQPAMFSCGIALYQLLKQVGVTPEVVIGHSLGEFTAAAAGGVCTPEQTARFVARRGRAMAALPGDHGAMAAIMADRETAKEFLVDGAVLANFNHPRQLVISGETDAVAEVVANAKRADVKAVLLSVSHGFHSPALSGLDSAPLLNGLEFHEPTVTVASGIDATPYANAAAAKDVFMKHAISPVDFERGLKQCKEAGANLYLQVGAGGPLTAFARGSLPRDHHGVYSLAGKRDDDGGRSLLESLAQLWVLGVNVDVTAITAPAEIASVPASILPKEKYWSVKDEAQLPVELKGVKARPKRTALPKETLASTTTDSGAQTEDSIDQKVLHIVGKVSAYPMDALKPSMTLVDDLGFDSLMVGDLATGLSDAFPSIDGIPQELLINRPSVQDIIDFARDSVESGSVTVHNDDAPLFSFRPSWQPRGLPSLPVQYSVSQKRVHILDARSTTLDSIKDEFTSAGAHVSQGTTLPEDPIDLLIYNAYSEDKVTVASIVTEGREWPDLAGEFISRIGPLSRQAKQPDVLCIAHSKDTWANGLHGVMRSLPREWPSIQATTLHLSAETVAQAGHLALHQYQSADCSPDVLHGNQGRHVLHFTKTQSEQDWMPTATDTVLISGGTRGIGFRLAQKLVALNARVIILGRSALNEEAQTFVTENATQVTFVQADVADIDGLRSALLPLTGPTAFVHCAGLLADGPLDSVDAADGARARHVKVDGWLNVLATCHETLQVAVGIGSWAGRFGNRHQAHYAAANALLSGLAEEASNARTTVVEYGPWTTSDMVQTIPTPIQAAMRSEGIDFVGDEAGMERLLHALSVGNGPLVVGRRVPESSEVTKWTVTLDTQTHGFLLDHAIEGNPILPLASATDLMAATARPQLPFEMSNIKLFQGVSVQEPVQLTLTSSNGRSEIRFADKGNLAYRSEVRATSATLDVTAHNGGTAPKTSLKEFYNGITFHGPLLQGIQSIDGMTDSFITGTVQTSSPADWMPDTARPSWSVDPLALDSAMQLSGLVAWDLYGRAGTPVGIGRYVQISEWPTQPLKAQVVYGAQDGDRFSGTIALFTESGDLVALAEDVVAELRGTTEATQEPAFEVEPEWMDPSQWKEVIEMEQRLQMAEMAGIKNPYFRVHQGTARDTTEVDGREMVNYSSYNYIGLSGDPRVLTDVREAVDRYGTSVSASRVASGERPFHTELEAELAAAQGAEDSIVFTAGHATNVTTIGHLFGPDDLIMHDEYIHDSALQGIKLSGASRRSFRHEEPEHLDEQLKDLRRHYKRVLIIVEGVYSMDGDICNLPAYLELKKKHGCLLMVDEAHSFGIVGKTGCGVGEHFGIDGREIDLWMGTLSKSLASCGGWISASKRLVNYLRYTAPGFVYSAGLTAANGVAALSSLRIMLEEQWRVEKLQSNAKFFHDNLVRLGVNTGPARGGSGVIPAITGNSMHALMLSQRMVEAGINVQPIVYPAVPDDAARLRFFLSSTHSEEQLLWTAEQCAGILKQVQSEFKL